MGDCSQAGTHSHGSHKQITSHATQCPLSFLTETPNPRGLWRQSLHRGNQVKVTRWVLIQVKTQKGRI